MHASDIRVWLLLEQVWLSLCQSFIACKGVLLPRVRIHNQNMTTAASAQADRKTFGHLS